MPPTPPGPKGGRGPPGALGEEKKENEPGKAGSVASGARPPGAQGDGKAQGGQGLAEEEEASAAQRCRLKLLHSDKLKQAPEGTVWSKGLGELHINFAELESLFQVGGWLSGGRSVGRGRQGIGWVGYPVDG